MKHIAHHPMTVVFFSLLLIFGDESIVDRACSGPAWASSAMSGLVANGRIIRDTAGRRIILKGLNVEAHTWGYEQASYDAHSKSWSIPQAQESILISTMQEMHSWMLTDEDMKRIRGWGANLVRIQVAHYLFESINSPGAYYNSGFSQLNRWIEMAAENGLYVIIDLHVPYGGRQYVDSDGMEGKTLWLNEPERLHVKHLWREIARNTHHHPNVLYELMNEPYPERAGKTSASWWALAQELVQTIRSEGAQHLIIAANPLPDGPFVKLSDSLNAIAYDFHFYHPYPFTHQQAPWMNPPFPPASYPYPNGWRFLKNTYDHDEPEFSGSEEWTKWHETFSTPEELCQDAPTHIQPTVYSYDNVGQICFDNVRLFIDSAERTVNNPGFEAGTGSFPDGWTQWGDPETNDALWPQDALTGNRFISIPSTAVKKTRAVIPQWGNFVALPSQYTAIRVEADVRGENRNGDNNHANVFGLNWVQQILYDRTTMESDMRKHWQFGLENNVPVMCLELGVIMMATEAQGHNAWLQDFTSLLDEKEIHGAYHAYRGYNDSGKSFGIYQCWGKPASQCPSDRKLEFVLPALRSWLSRRQTQGLPWMLLLD